MQLRFHGNKAFSAGLLAFTKNVLVTIAHQVESSMEDRLRHAVRLSVLRVPVV